MNPKISVIVPCKNSEKTIQKTFDSLRNQEYSNLECIVVDGFSKDSTMSIVNNNLDIVTKVISEEDKSAAEAQNKGIKLATGELISYLHSDDYYEDNMLSEISKAFLNNQNIKIFSFGMEIENLIDKKVRLSSYKKKNLELKLNNILFKHPLGHFYHKSIFEDFGYNKTFSQYGDDFYANDKEFLIRLCLKGVKNIVIEKVLYRMRSHENSNTLSRKNIESIRYQHIEIADYYINLYKEHIYKHSKLIEFKVHNLALLFVYYVLTLRTNKMIKIFNEGFQRRGLMFFFDIFSCPIRELIYRGSVKKWF